MSLQDATDDELVAELTRRGKNPQCRCRRWKTYLGTYDQDGHTWRCRGCFRAVGKCACW